MIIKLNKEYMDWKDYEHFSNDLIKQLKQRQIKFNNVFAIPRGGLVLGVTLSHHLGIPLITNIEDVNVRTLIVDDISDNGNTIERMKDNLKNVFKIEGNVFATLIYTTHTRSIPDYSVYCRKSDWIVFPWEEQK